VQLAPAASVAPQVVAEVVAKSLGLVPVMLNEIPVSAAFPVFESVTGSAVAVDPTVVPGNASEFGLSAATGAAAALPVPLTAMDCVALDTFSWLSVRTILPDRLPEAVGVKLTETSQVAPSARGVPEAQRLVSAMLTGKFVG